MIALASDCLMFELAGGEMVPLAAAHIAVELDAETAAIFDAEFIRHAAKAIFHYFRYELGRQTVTVAEFAGALEKVLSGFALRAPAVAAARPKLPVLESDLCRLANEPGTDSELFFYPRLRQELRRQLSQAPRVVRFRGLRNCVKRLTGAQRWSPRCRQLQDQIVAYLRECLGAEPRQAELALMVDSL